jgi:hypothetical protein
MGPWQQWTFLGVIAVLSVAHSIWLDRANGRVLRSLKAEFARRPRLDLETWSARWAEMGLPQGRLLDLLRPVAKVLECDVTQLQPSDSFTGTLRWRGKTFLGVDDANPWDEYLEEDLPAVCGGLEKSADVMLRIEGNPTLAALVEAAA